MNLHRIIHIILFIIVAVTFDVASLSQEAKEECLPAPFRVNDTIYASPFYLKINTVFLNQKLSEIQKPKGSSLEALADIFQQFREKKYGLLNNKFLKRGEVSSEDWLAICDRLHKSITTDVTVNRFIQINAEDSFWSYLPENAKYNFNLLIKNINGKYEFGFSANEPLYVLFSSLVRNECKQGAPMQKTPRQQFEIEAPLSFNGTQSAALCFDAHVADVVIPATGPSMLSGEPYHDALMFMGGIIKNLHDNSNIEEALSKMGEKTQWNIRNDIKWYKEQKLLKEHLDGWFSPKRVRIIIENENFVFLFFHNNTPTSYHGEIPHLSYYILQKTENGSFKFVNYHYYQGFDQVLGSSEFQYALKKYANNHP